MGIRFSVRRNSSARFAASYFMIVGAFLLMVGVAFSLIFVPRYETEVALLNESKLETVSLVIDTQVLEPLDALYMRIIGGGFDLGDFAFEGRHPREDIYGVFRTHRELQNIINEYPDLLESIAIYYPAVAFLNSSTGFRFLDPLETTETLGSSSWLTGFNAMGPREWIATEVEKSYSYVTPEQEAVVVSIRAVPQNADRNSRFGAVLFSVRASYLEQIVNSYLRHEAHLFQILDPEGTAIFEHRSSNEGTGPLENQPANTVMSTRRSESAQWTYQLMIPENVYFARVSGMRALAVWIALFLLGVGVALSMFASHRAYTPILEIVHTASSALHALGWQESPMPEDDYQFLRSTVGLLSESVEGLRDRISESLPLMKQSFYANLLRGVAYSDDDLHAKSDFLMIRDFASKYLVALITTNLSESEIRRSELLKLALIHTSESVSIHRGSVYALEYDMDTLALIINHDDQTDVDRVLTATQSVLSMRLPDGPFDYRVSVGVSVESLRRIHVSFQSAERALEYAFMYPDRRILKAEDLLSNRHEGALLSFFQVSEFTTLVRTLDADKISTYLDELFKRFHEERVSIETARHILMEILASVTIVLGDRGVSFGDENIDEQFDACATSMNLNVFQNNFILLIRNIKMLSQRQRQHVHESLITGIQQYIRDHLQEDLSLRSISDRFNVSYSHLSSLFKEVSSKTLSRFVTECRLARARELIEEQKLNIDEIAAATGFSESGYFIRKFKAFYGLTPGELKLKKSIEKGSGSRIE